MAIIKNKDKDVNDWLEENIKNFGVDLGNHLYFIRDELFDLFLERIRESGFKNYDKISSSSIKIVNMSRNKITPPDNNDPPRWFLEFEKRYQQDQEKSQNVPPKWFLEFEKRYQEDQEKIQNIPPKWFNIWIQESFNPLVNEVKRQGKLLERVIELNKLKS